MASGVVEKFYSMEYGPAPEDASEVVKWLEAHGRRFGNYIGGKWTAVGAETFETKNPATGEVLATVATAGASDVDAAVKAARAALPGWQALTGHQRARYLYALARQVQKHARKLAVLETLDNGKSIRESRDIDIPLVARHFYHHAGWAQLRDEELVGYEPVGVVGQIIPWNFPLLMFAWKVAPALAAGCTVVIKPAEYTPLSALALAEIADEIGLPAGVLNVVNGAGETGAAITSHPGIDKIAFTGSTEVGRIIRKATAGTSKKLSLELGGKSPFIVFDDADLDSAVEGLVDGIWFNQGQVCCAGSRLLVQERVAERLLDKVKARMQTLRVGSPLDKAVDIGAIVDAVQLERIAGLVKQGVAEGATCWQPEMSMPEKGLFYKPTLLTDVSPASTVAQEEIFGPVLVAMTFRTPAEAVELANNTTYGLAASIWSENINVALDVAAQVKAGVVWVNATNLFDAACGFGGYRESGYGREGGKEGMYEYLVPEWAEAATTTVTQQASLQTHVSEARHGAPSSSEPALGIDRTVKQYIGGKQTRPDSGYSYPVYGRGGELVGEAPLGSRKDVRNAVEAARGMSAKWAKTAAHGRAQVLYFLAENLMQRKAEIAAKLAAFVGEAQAEREIEATIERTFAYAAWADKYEGSVHNPPMKMVTLAMKEAVGVVGVLAPEDAPLLGLMSLVLPAIAMGNTVVAVPSETTATLMAELYQVLDTSDVPGGVVNLVAGPPLSLGKTLAEHDDVDAVWSFRDEVASAMVKAASIGNLKQVFANDGRAVDWFNAKAEGRWWLRHATQVKNIWVPYGE
ncbi:aldehyde dehydrogenase family protein [Granulicella sp. 5B5]|uniref:aldehyde dehydrogenase family protein n=1 Tax=Granulicella sp. 5B5 TaxID=1617967 RepID=UPI0015F76F1B|nr:aldehyde dehydrogenase family protein [Granulicella sp. 5B5]QMV19937.1 aldehyde dehydrogenase family protein [Granulicella sp. 5B5]